MILFKPSYQIEIFEVALRRNTIAVLDTGSGKTFIAIMLMKRVGEELRSRSDKRLTIFLAPTVHLVNQVNFPLTFFSSPVHRLAYLCVLLYSAI